MRPVAIHFVYALAHGSFGTRTWAPRLLEALAFASLVIAFAHFSARHLDDARPSAVGGLRNLLRQHYRRAAHIEDLELYLRSAPD